MIDKKDKSLGEVVSSIIKNDIFIHEIYQPGDKLPVEKELANKLKVSRTALREGIKDLESKGILEIKRGVGTFVSKDFGFGLDTKNLKVEDIQRILLKDWYEMRILFEVPAMSLVAERATDKEIEEIENIQNEIKILIEQDKSFLELDYLFHKKLTLATHNNVLIKTMYENKVWEWSYYLIAKNQKNLKVKMQNNAFNNHTSIVNFLKDRDGEGAEMAMRYHLITAINDVK
ncbi:FadR/GntR family transcriptional regulator [Miniphocaeibacter halophilus]|uniref:FadR family transcriptional regulator n=1 Tax=Miniphocaeibacter halophilus TaxID=2931922 RepID=A0AC61MTS5_9FIRM|nr:FadR/GntR family transcriptional regulator [Miniphocaeibacter halophilus]QQK08927.1 FadR family transcriptional regulator [Miniphocaeibacter halophilus]